MINHTEYIEKFLLRNGFSNPKTNFFVNQYCDIEIIEEIKDSEISNEIYSYYKITFRTKDYRENMIIYSDDLQIYWLIGALTYTGLMDKNYKS